MQRWDGLIEFHNCWALRLALASALVPAAIGSANASETFNDVSCRIEIGRSTFGPTRCDVTRTDREIAFSWAGVGTRTYRGVLSLENESRAAGRWNGFSGGALIDLPLGRLTAEDACWRGDDPRANICLYFPTDTDEASEGWETDSEGYDEDYRELDVAHSSAATAPRDRSSFRGLFLGMPVGSIAASIDGDFSLTTQNTAGNELSQFFETVRGLEAAQSLFIQQSGRNCGQVLHDGDVVTKLTLYQCFFNLTGNITAEEFARQVLERYPMRDGMQGRQQMLGDGAYRFLYTEYTGHTANERLVVSHHQMFDRVELAVSPVSQARF